MRYYSSTAQAMSLTGAINSSALTIGVNSVSGLPASYPFSLVLDVGLAAEEVVTVTGAAGTTLTIIRGEDGTAAQSHSTGAVVRHMMTARDLREPQQHIEASSGVHGIGVGASVVGTSTPQTLTQKSISGATNTITNVPQSAVVGLGTSLSTLATADTTEANARIAGDSTVTALVTAEAASRAAADTALQGRATALEIRPRHYVVTAATRPTLSQCSDGDVIYESDTLLTRVRVGTIWKHVGGNPGFKMSNPGTSVGTGWNRMDMTVIEYDDMGVAGVQGADLTNNWYVLPNKLSGLWWLGSHAAIGNNPGASAIGTRIITSGGVILGPASQHSIVIAAGIAQTVETFCQSLINGPVNISADFYHNFAGGQGVGDFAFSGHLIRASDATVTA